MKKHDWFNARLAPAGTASVKKVARKVVAASIALLMVVHAIVGTIYYTKDLVEWLM